MLAQSYPTKPMHIVVPYRPGSGGDMQMRRIGPPLSESTCVAKALNSTEVKGKFEVMVTEPRSMGGP